MRDAGRDLAANGDTGPLPVADTSDAASLCSGRPPSQAGGLVAWYRCEPGVGTSATLLSDASSHGNDGQLVTGASTGQGTSFGAGRIGQALYFSPTNQGYAALPSVLLTNACEATVATWVYLNSAGAWQRIFDFGRPESDGKSNVYMYLTAQDANNKGLHFAISKTGPGSGEEWVDGPGLATKTWHHVAVVLGPDGAVLYLDGVQVGANPKLALRPADLPHPLDYLIARSQWRLYDYFLDGAVDEFRVYDRALARDEIQALASGS